VPQAILVVDDEPAIIELARMYLQRDGFQVHAADNGERALPAVEAFKPDLVILDLMLPGVDGLEICRRLRAAGNRVPILILTARDEDVDKILGLELGADDYLTKPFNPRELVARVKAILRREMRPQAATESPMHLGDLTINKATREVRIGERLVDLRTREFELLAVLAEQPGRVFTREQLLREAWGYEYFGQTRTVDVHVGQLRKKLAGASAHVETISGVGYKLAAADPGRRDEG